MLLIGEQLNLQNEWERGLTLMMNLQENIFPVYLIAVNLLLFVTMGADKRLAIGGMRRVPEKTLFLLAIIGGAVGGIAGMYVFRHKTKHKSFTIGFPVILIIQAALLFFGGCAAAPDTEEGKAFPAGTEQVRVAYLDVGQGDSIFAELPGGECLLIDGGESENSSKVADYIQREGFDRIDYLVATHPHSDHIGSLPEIIRQFDIGKVYMPKVQTNTQLFERLLDEIQSKGLKITEAKAGVTVKDTESLNMEFVAPTGQKYSDLNNASAVLRLRYGETSFLFTGDAEKESEDDISMNVQAQVLKAGHHGSEYSSSEAFLNRVSPKYVVISCGAGNQYGHPDEAALDRFAAVGAKVFRTDKQGNIIIASDGKNIAAENEPVSGENAVQGNSAAAQNGSKSGAAPQGQKETAANTHSDSASDTVYITDTGEKFHRENCSSLRDSRIAVSRQDAVNRGYEPCGRCRP